MPIGGFNSFGAMPKFPRWLYTVASRASLRMRRRRKGAPERELSLEEFVPTSAERTWNRRRRSALARDRGAHVERWSASVVWAAMLGQLLGALGFAATPEAPAGLEQGRLIYQRHCADCHGPEGRGDGQQATSLSPRPGNLISAQTSAKSDQELLKIIGNGRPRTAMAGWADRLSSDEQAAVLAYIRSLVKFTRSATPPPPQP